MQHQQPPQQPKDNRVLLMKWLNQTAIHKDTVTFWERLTEATGTPTEVKRTFSTIGAKEWLRCIDTGAGICTSHVPFAINTFFYNVKRSTAAMQEFANNRI